MQEPYSYASLLNLRLQETPVLCLSMGTIGVSFRLMVRESGKAQGMTSSQSQTVTIERAVAISTDEAATRRAAPYMLAKM